MSGHDSQYEKHDRRKTKQRRLRVDKFTRDQYMIASIRQVVGLVCDDVPPKGQLPNIVHAAPQV